MNPKKLGLHSETLRTLSTEELEAIHGGGFTRVFRKIYNLKRHINGDQPKPGERRIHSKGY